MNNSDMPAMAVKVVASVAARRQAEGAGIPCDDISFTGLTKREYFAGMAMQGLLACETVGLIDVERIAVCAADRLLKELAK